MMMYLDILPDAIQQIFIASILLYVAYRLGRRTLLMSKTSLTPPQDEFYHKLVKWLLVFTTVIYAEAVLQCTMTMAQQEEDEILPGDVYRGDSSDRTAQWLKSHSDLFWFIVGMRQTTLMGILAFELMDQVQVRKLVWFGLIPFVVQWHVGLFGQDPMGGAVVGLLFETLSPLLLIVYTIKSCTAQNKLRAAYAAFAILFYIISALPVMFLALEMRGPHEVLYLTIFFGWLSFFCWSRATVKTPQKSKTLNIERMDVTKGSIEEEDGTEQTVFTLTPLSTTEPAFSVEEDQDP